MWIAVALVLSVAAGALVTWLVLRRRTQMAPPLHSTAFSGAPAGQTDRDAATDKGPKPRDIAKLKIQSGDIDVVEITRYTQHRWACSRLST